MSEAAANDPVLCSVDARGVARVTLNRPEVYNAYNGELIAALLAIYDSLAGKALRAVVIAGKGRNFQAGADINWLDSVRRSSPEENVRASRMTAEAVQRLNLLPVPTVALVQGACFGGGTGIVSACDIVIAADNAMFSIAEVRIGVAGTIIIPQLNDAIGLRQVRRYALTGERFNAQEAHRIGLVHEIVPLAELEAAGERIVNELLTNGPDAVAQTKICALRSAWSHLDEADIQWADRKPRRQAAIGRSGRRICRVPRETSGALESRRKKPRLESGQHRMPHIEVADVSLAYDTPSGLVQGVKDARFSIEQSEFLCLVGPSGCGKSTLLNIIAGFLTPTAGHIRIGGKPVTGYGMDRGVVFQDFAQLFPWRTALGNVTFGLEMKGIPKVEREEIAREQLRLVKLEKFADSYPHHLSGGMQQRVAIARALAYNPAVLLMDEPFAALDALTRDDMQRLLADVWRETRKTVIYVTHNVAEAAYLADRVVVMTPHPGTVKVDIKVPLARPRDPLSVEFVECQKELLRHLGNETTQDETSEIGDQRTIQIIREDDDDELHKRNHAPPGIG